jgi:nucleotide-binding universal stress UspA family protein
MKFLAAVDLSDASLLALDALRAIAGDRAGDATLLHVVDLDLYTAGGSVPGIMEFAEERLRTESGRLADCGLRAASVRVEQGDSTETILRVAAEENADLIVMTNLGKGARTGRLFGSTAERVAANGEVPVLIERVGFAEDGCGECCRLTPSSPLDRVLVATDLDESRGSPLEFVLALQGVTAVRVVHVVPDSAASGPAAETLRALVREAPGGIELETAVLIGTPARAIVEDASSWGATTIALQPGGRGPLHRAVWGSVARQVALNAPSSVLFVPSRS